MTGARSAPGTRLVVGPVCQIRTCDAAARWTIRLDGHPNARPGYTIRYCTEHALRLLPLTEATRQEYRVVITGPLPLIGTSAREGAA